MKISKQVEFLSLLGIMIFSFVCSFLIDDFSSILFTIFIIGTLFAIFYAYISTSKYKYFFRSLYYFSVFHFLLFPYIYLFLLKVNPKSFQINSVIKENEIENVTFDNQKELKEIQQKQLILAKLILSKESMLDSLSTKDNVSFQIDNVLVSVRNFPLRGGGGGIAMPPPLIIHIDTNMDINEVLIENMYSPVISIRKVLQKKLLELNELKNVNIQYKSEIDKSNIWNYNRILPYSANMFLTDHIKPLSKTACMVYYFHDCIIMFFMSIMGAAYYDVIKNKEKND